MFALFALTIAVSAADPVIVDASGDPLPPAFSPDGSKYALGTAEKIILFDAATGNIIREFDGNQRASRHLMFTRDGKRLVTSDGDGTVWVWNAAVPK